MKLYQELVDEDPKDEQSLLRISQIYQQKRDFAKAREAADKAKELDPNNLEIQYNDVNLLEAEGRIPDAIKTLKGILDATAKKSYSAAERNNRTLLLDGLGELYQKAEQYNAAVEAFRQMAELDPDVRAARCRRNRRDLPRSQGFSQGGSGSRRRVKKYPNDRLVRSVHASLLADLGKTDQAVAETRKLLDGKNDRETYINLAQIYDKAKNFAEMAKMLDAAEKLSASNEDKEAVIFMRGAMYRAHEELYRGRSGVPQSAGDESGQRVGAELSAATCWRTAMFGWKKRAI